jgi:alkylation response protein AidB-like acyl-CoA dehydrogenase
VVYVASAGSTLRSVDPSRSLAEARSGAVLADGAAGAVARALDFGALACSAQLHGAIGYTAEHELSRFLLQVRALVPAWGSQAEHRARVLREL